MRNAENANNETIGAGPQHESHSDHEGGAPASMSDDVAVRRSPAADHRHVGDAARLTVRDAVTRITSRRSGATRIRSCCIQSIASRRDDQERRR